MPEEQSIPVPPRVATNDRHTNEIVVELKSLVEIDAEMAQARADRIAKKGAK